MDEKIPGTPLRKSFDEETSLLANIDDVLLLRKEFNYFPEFETTPQKFIRPLRTPVKQNPNADQPRIAESENNKENINDNNLFVRVSNADKKFDSSSPKFEEIANQKIQEEKMAPVALPYDEVYYKGLGKVKEISETIEKSLMNIHLMISEAKKTLLIENLDEENEWNQKLSDFYQIFWTSAANSFLLNAGGGAEQFNRTAKTLKERENSKKSTVTGKDLSLPLRNRFIQERPASCLKKMKDDDFRKSTKTPNLKSFLEKKGEMFRLSKNSKEIKKTVKKH